MHMLGILLALSYPGTVLGTIFACQSGDTVIYQDRDCPREKKVKKRKKVANLYPLGIHGSWFDLPDQAIDRAFCDRRGCECGDMEIKHRGSLIDAVSQALYLDGSWHRYESTLAQWTETPTTSSEYFSLQDQMLEASCDVMMAQTLLRAFAEGVVAELGKRNRTAEERGFDDPLACEQEIPEACSYYDSVMQYQRVKQDAKLLKNARIDDTQSDEQSDEEQPDLGAGLPQVP